MGPGAVSGGGRRDAPAAGQGAAQGRRRARRSQRSAARGRAASLPGESGGDIDEATRALAAEGHAARVLGYEQAWKDAAEAFTKRAATRLGELVEEHTPLPRVGETGDERFHVRGIASVGVEWPKRALHPKLRLAIDFSAVVDTLPNGQERVLKSFQMTGSGCRTRTSARLSPPRAAQAQSGRPDRHGHPAEDVRRDRTPRLRRVHDRELVTDPAPGGPPPHAPLQAQTRIVINKGTGGRRGPASAGRR